LIAEVRSELAQQSRTVAASAEETVADTGRQQAATAGSERSEERVAPREVGTPLRPTGNGARM
jgi:hypothetical protein